MGRIPYRPPVEDPRAERVADLVRRIADNRRALLSHRAVFRNLDRVVKDPWKTGPVALDERALVGELPPGEIVSLRLDPALTLEWSQPVRVRVARAAPDRVVLRRGSSEIGAIMGLAERLDLLEHILGGAAEANAEETLLPKDLDRFRRLAASRSVEVDRLLEEGRVLVEEVERLVCALYDVPADLTEEVVAHAVARTTR